MAAQNARILAVQAGPELLGCLMDWALLGVLTIQVYLYYVKGTCEPLCIQLLVYVTFIVEILQTVNLTGLVWQGFVVNYGQVAALSTVHVGWLPLPIACSIVSLIAQGFFAWRILVLSKSSRLVVVIVPLALMQVICGIFVGVKLQDGQSNSQFLSSKAALVVTSLWMAGSAFVDVLIAVIMTFQMVKWKTGIAATDKIINKIIRLVVETGSLTASVATVGLVLAIVAPDAAYYQPAIYVLTKLYSNTFLTNLTNRFFLPRDAGRQPRNQGSTEGTSFAFTSVFVDMEELRSQEPSHAHGDGRSSVIG
ncbi:hypothetical protein C8Q72DRAFT_888901 [Fomitopsis betulina]|nr:hypothetical protein C8Q72DRAFT_888901 [Fomitopsis betulina]